MFNFLTLYGDSLLYIYTIAMIIINWIIPLFKFIRAKINVKSSDNGEHLSGRNDNGRWDAVDGLDRCEFSRSDSNNRFYNGVGVNYIKRLGKISRAKIVSRAKRNTKKPK